MNQPIFQNTIIPSPDKALWQHIYSSQIYGTFFSIYINLVNDKSDYNKLVSAQFKLINYKGPINIGIHRVLKPKKDGKGIYFTIYVKGLSSKRTSRKIDLSKFKFRKNVIPVINIHRKIEPINNGSAYKGQVFDSENFYRDIENIQEPFSSEFKSYRDADSSECPPKKKSNLKKKSQPEDLSCRCPRGQGRIPNLNQVWSPER